MINLFVDFGFNPLNMEALLDLEFVYPGKGAHLHECKVILEMVLQKKPPQATQSQKVRICMEISITNKSSQ